MARPRSERARSGTTLTADWPPSIERVLEAHAVAVGERPPGVPQEPVNLDAGERFIGHVLPLALSRPSL